MSNSTSVQILSRQWQNPSDVLSLLLLIGGDIIQKALAQLVGVGFAKRGGYYCLYLTPVAFSFGWVAFGFQSLMTIFGEQRLMPQPDCESLVVNCGNAFVRQNRSWVLGRLVRDYEKSVQKDSAKAPLDSQGRHRPVSLKIDIFRASPNTEPQNPAIGKSWYFAWTVILVQQVLAFLPWIFYGEWATFMVTICGTVFALFTGSLRQWTAEKWTSRRLRKEKVVALTRGNGSQYAMVIISPPGSIDVEAMSSGRLATLPETPWLMALLTLLWTVLLLTVSGLKMHSWYLVGVGVLGMFQNVYGAAAKRTAAESKLPLRPHETYPNIIGYQMESSAKDQEKARDDPSSDEEPSGTELPPNKAAYNIDDVMGALCELEKRIPRAGASLLSIFFDTDLQYDSSRFIFNKDKKFWKLAFRKLGKPVPR